MLQIFERENIKFVTNILHGMHLDLKLRALKSIKRHCCEKLTNKTHWTIIELLINSKMLANVIDLEQQINLLSCQNKNYITTTNLGFISQCDYTIP